MGVIVISKEAYEAKRNEKLAYIKKAILDFERNGGNFSRNVVRLILVSRIEEAALSVNYDQLSNTPNGRYTIEKIEQAVSICFLILDSFDVPEGTKFEKHNAGAFVQRLFTTSDTISRLIKEFDTVLYELIDAYLKPRYAPAA